jgi:1-phosphofructokinase family hexose kinase
MLFTVTLNPAVDRELIVPEIQFDSVLRASAWRVDWGGKGFNVSRMLRSLGVASQALGFAGGKSGEMLRDGLKQLGVETDFVWVEGETRTNVSIVADTSYHYIKVNEPGPNISPAQVEELLKKVKEKAQAGDWWVLSGSLPPGVSKTFYQEMIKVINAAGAHVILDAEGEALRLGCEARPFLVKPNHHEAEKLTGMQTETVEEAVKTGQAILKLGMQNVVISMGEIGAVLVNNRGAWLVHSPKIEMRNPIGAGDSLVGGLVWGLNQGLDVLQALEWGVSCGAATASLSGTAVGPKDLVEHLKDQIRVDVCFE